MYPSTSSIKRSGSYWLSPAYADFVVVGAAAYLVLQYSANLGFTYLHICAPFIAGEERNKMKMRDERNKPSLSPHSLDFPRDYLNQF